MNWKDKRLAVAVAAILILASLILLYPSGGAGGGYEYKPSIDLPADYVVLVDQPEDEYDLMFIAALSSIVVRNNGYHPMFILEDGSLDAHQLWSMEHMNLIDLPKIIFTDQESTLSNLKSQIPINDNFTFLPKPTALGLFKGFNGFISVGSYEEALWVSSLANVQNKVIVIGESTYSSQREVWNQLKINNIDMNYVIIVSPYDLNTDTLENNIVDYDRYDSKYHIPALSAVAAEMAAYHNAYVLTEYTPSIEPIYDFKSSGNYDMNTNYALNSRSIGIYLELKNLTSLYGIPEYVCIVGSAAAVPQFQFPGNGDGDVLVNSDVVFGFLDDDKYTMDAAVGRIVNLNVQGASNLVARTLGYERFVDAVVVDYSDIAGGTQDVDWKHHGASFSGYQITYQRMQATPARWICQDFEDESMEYEYFGPSGVGELIGDGTKNSDERDIGTICEASGMVAYRGHGSDTGSLYSIRVYGPNGEEGVLRGEDAANLNLPPQVSSFVACMNAKIHGTDFGVDAPDCELEKLFAINYLYGGAVALMGATEVSYSNVGQDISSLWAEYGFGIFHDDNHEWDLNDAWYAFFWDGILNHEDEHGTVGKALQWAENRYIAYHDETVSPFDCTDDDNLGGHWKEVAMFCVYGDPAFMPYTTSPGANSYDPWHNGAEDN
jgi:hypothetical protein